MPEFTTTITQRSQVTVPVQVRRALGLKPRDKVTFTIDGGVVRLKPASYTLKSVYGSVQAAERPEDFDRISRDAKALKADLTLEKLRQT